MEMNYDKLIHAMKKTVNHKIITVTDGISELNLGWYLDEGYEIILATPIEGNSYGYNKVGVQYVLRKSQ